MSIFSLGVIFVTIFCARLENNKNITRDIPENWAKKNNIIAMLQKEFRITKLVFSNIESKFQRIAKFFRRMKSKNELIDEYLKLTDRSCVKRVDCNEVWFQVRERKPHHRGSLGIPRRRGVLKRATTTEGHKFISMYILLCVLPSLNKGFTYLLTYLLKAKIFKGEYDIRNKNKSTKRAFFYKGADIFNNCIWT